MAFTSFTPDDDGPQGGPGSLQRHDDIHLASFDYPELEEILANRPPPERQQKTASAPSEALCALCNAEPVLREVNGTSVGARCAEHLMGVPQDQPTEAPGFGEAVYGSKEAGFLDFLDRHMPKSLQMNNGAWSYDWCRFRRNSHCYYPSHLDAAATSQAGYPVWTPQDRGLCPRITWNEQERCPVGEPGPKSGAPHSFTDATVPWSQGGQHGGHPGEPNHLPSFRSSKVDEDLKFHFTSSWGDIQAKARDIRKDGSVRIISAPSDSNPYIVAEVKGTTATYQTTLMRTIGGKSVAAWECGCAWGHYSWGRSGRWKKFEGRMCSHALATVYQAQSEEMFGGKVKEIERRPIHFDYPTWYKAPAQTDWRMASKERGTEKPQKCKYCQAPATKSLLWAEGMAYIPACDDHEDKARHRIEVTNNDEVVGIHEVNQKKSHLFNDYFCQDPPIFTEAAVLMESGVEPQRVVDYLQDLGINDAVGIIEASLDRPFKARDPHDELHTIVEVNGDHAITDIGEAIPVHFLNHPQFDPKSGLEPGPKDSLMHQPEDGTEWAEDKLAQVASLHYRMAADGDNQDGVMIALVPPLSVTGDLAIQGGEPIEDLHTTVAYLGKADDVDYDRLHAAAQAFASTTPPVTATISGFGNFEQEDGHVHVALVSIPGIDRFRTALMSFLGGAGISVTDKYGVQPHITLAYADQPMEYEQMPEAGAKFRLGHITVAHRGEWTHYPLEGEGDLAKASVLFSDPGPLLVLGAEGDEYGSLLHPHDQPPEPAGPRSPGRADNPNATKLSRLPKSAQDKIADRIKTFSPPSLGHLTVNRMAENIKAVHRDAMATNPKAVEAGKNWYKEGHEFAKNLASQHHDGNLRKSIGMTAALSPQCHWEENKEQAKYLHHHLSADPESNDGKLQLSPEHLEMAHHDIASHAKDTGEEGGAGLRLTPGKKFSDMGHIEAAQSLKAQAKYTHQLTVPGRLKNNGEPWRAVYSNGTGSIAKAVRIHRGEDPDKVLNGHKVRSFFNNLADPDDKEKREDVTIDTHAVSAAAHAKIGASSDVIKNLFASGSQKEHNVTGTYSHIADAYRKAHSDLKASGEMAKDSPVNHLQASTWVHWRDMNDEPGPIKEKNRGRFPSFSKKSQEPQWGDPRGNAGTPKHPKKVKPNQPVNVMGMVRWSADNKKSNPGKLLNPMGGPEGEDIDPDFDPELADQAEKAEWEAEPDEMKLRLEQESLSNNPYYSTMVRWAAQIISEDEARGDSRPVSQDEFHGLAEEGRQKLDEYKRNSSPIKGLDDHWDAIKRDMYRATREPWGGGTIDAHTGSPVTNDGGDKYALTVKEPGKDKVSVHPDAPEHEFHAAMDQAKERFRPLLERQNHHLGVFHDADVGRIDIDPTIVTRNHHDVETIGAHTHAIGGAYNFRDGNGYWPPHVKQGSLDKRTSMVRWATADSHEEAQEAKQTRDQYSREADDAQSKFYFNHAPEKNLDQHPEPQTYHQTSFGPKMSMVRWADKVDQLVRTSHEHAWRGVAGGVQTCSDPNCNAIWDMRPKQAGYVTIDEARAAARRAAELHDHPEPALPSTDGAEPVDPISVSTPVGNSDGHVNETGQADADRAFLAPGGTSNNFGVDHLTQEMHGLDMNASLDPMNDAIDPRTGMPRPQWLKGSGGGAPTAAAQADTQDIAAMAKHVLATGQIPKEAAKEFTPQERQVLIQEGNDGTRAANLDRLDIADTHYANMQDAEEEEDLSWLM